MRSASVFFAVMMALAVCVFPARAADNPPAAAVSPAPAGTRAPLVLEFFYSPTCPLCEPAKQAVAAAEKHFGARVRVRRHVKEETFTNLLNALDYYQIEETPKLAVFFGARAVLDNDIIDKLQPLVEKALAENQTTPDFARFGLPADAGDGAQNPQETGITENAGKIAEKRASLAIVITTGLADGFNPCAFATVILFISMLTAAGRERRTILAIGIAFIVAVFLTYLLMGVGAFAGIQYLQASKTFKFAALAIKWISLLMVTAAAVLSLIDAWRAFRSHGTEKMLLVLPDGLKDRIRKRLRATAHGSSLLAGAFVSGVIISFLEAACTGQTYLPVITLLVEQGQSTRGYALLLLYNVLFIIPLIAVFLMAFFGMTSEQIGNVARRKVWLTKLLLGLVFAAMAVWLGKILLPTVTGLFA